MTMLETLLFSLFTFILGMLAGQHIKINISLGSLRKQLKRK